jgi:NADPH-dependent glutamate synthase beta subunit-like oxidoreductase
MQSSTKYDRAALISTFIVGGGQFYTGRLWAGVVLALIFYGSIALMAIIWTGMNQAFWGLLGAWIVVWLYNIIDAYKGFQYQKPPCEKVCPAGMAPWTYINFIATKSNQQYPFIPFFETLGRICLAPCEDHCTRRGIDAPVAIRYLKHGVTTEMPDHVHKLRKEKIAIVGAGPCGLSAAYYLTHRGYKVVVYEREEKPGGVPGILIPEFRLPQTILDREIDILQRMGIELKYGVEVGKDTSIHELLQNYDAIFIAIGVWKPIRLGIPGEEHALDGFDVLRQMKKGELYHLGKVGVVGGGNTAIDIARSLVREGHDVKIYYRRNIEDMPAENENLEEAQEEGIEIIPLTVPVKIDKNNVTMVKTDCPYGRKGPVKIMEGSEFNVTLDNVVMAIGQLPETDFLKDVVKLDKIGRVVIKNGRTSHPKIFAGGDVILGSATVAHAVGHGMNTAQRIDYFLRRIPPFIGQLFKKTYKPKVHHLAMIDRDRMTIPHRDIEERKRDFKEVELWASKEELQKEAARCLACPLRYHPR